MSYRIFVIGCALALWLAAGLLVLEAGTASSGPVSNGVATEPPPTQLFPATDVPPTMPPMPSPLPPTVPPGDPKDMAFVPLVVDMVSAPEVQPTDGPPTMPPMPTVPSVTEGAPTETPEARPTEGPPTSPPLAAQP